MTDLILNWLALDVAGLSAFVVLLYSSRQRIVRCWCAKWGAKPEYCYCVGFEEGGP